MIDAVAAGVGGMVGMAGALGYGFKMLVDVVSRQMTAQNQSINNLETNISSQLKEHILDCRKCQVVGAAALVSQSAAAVTAAAAQTAQIVSAIEVVSDGIRGSGKQKVST